MKTIAASLFAMFACSILFACNDRDTQVTVPQEDSSLEIKQRGGDQQVTTLIIRDKDSGCEYLAITTGSGVAITPRSSGMGTQMCL